MYAKIVSIHRVDFAKKKTEIKPEVGKRLKSFSHGDTEIQRRLFVKICVICG